MTPKLVLRKRPKKKKKKDIASLMKKEEKMKKKKKKIRLKFLKSGIKRKHHYNHYRNKKKL